MLPVDEKPVTAAAGGDPMRDYLEQRERDLETRIVGLEALLCDAQAEVERLKDALQKIVRTDDGAADEIERLEKMVRYASDKGVTFPPDTLPKVRAAVIVVDPADGSERLVYDPDAEASAKH